MITGEIFFSNLSAGQQYFSNDKKNFVKKNEICLKKKNPPEHKYSVTFASKAEQKHSSNKVACRVKQYCSNQGKALNVQTAF